MLREVTKLVMILKNVKYTLNIMILKNVKNTLNIIR